MPKQMGELINRQIMRSKIAAQQAEESGLPAVKPVVTISRTMGSGARIIAQKLAADLGWSLWDKDLLDAVAGDTNVSRKIVEAFDEKSYSEIELLFRDILGERDMGGFMYARHLIRVVHGIAKLGNAIILGRGANFILPKALHVRIDAPLPMRVRNLMTYENLTEAEATEKIHHSDRDREHFLRTTFGKETTGHCVYHLSLCMCAFTNDGAVEIIKQAIRSKFGLP